LASSLAITMLKEHISSNKEYVNACIIHWYYLYTSCFQFKIALPSNNIVQGLLKLKVG